MGLGNPIWYVLSSCHYVLQVVLVVQVRCTKVARHLHYARVCVRSGTDVGCGCVHRRHCCVRVSFGWLSSEGVEQR